MHLHKLIDSFLSDPRTRGQLKPSTQRAYRKDVVAAAAALPGAIEQITGACLTTYLAADIAPSTVARRLAALRALFGWALREGYIVAPPPR
jgi:site-specific recombinase XerD